MTIRSGAARGAMAIAALVLLAGTVLAADPSVIPSGSPDVAASASAATSPSAEASASASAAATTAPAASTEPAESESPEASEPPESPEASKSPAAATAEDADDNDGPPSAEQIADVVGRLKAAGIPATAIEVQVLSGKVGLGGAVRVLAFSQASGKTPGQILAMFTSGMGWGQIRHELNLSIGPGIGWIMGHGHGNGKGPKP